jgi:hypothetical protein
VGRATWPRIPASCANARALVHGGRGEGGIDLAVPRCIERGRAGGATARCLAKQAREAEREEGREGGSNWRRQVGPTGQRAREERVGSLAPIGGVRLLGASGARARARAGLGLVG